MENAGTIINAARKGASIAGTGLGKQIVGFLSQPVFRDLAEDERLRIQNLDNEEEEESKKLSLEKITKGIRDNFAFGDALSILGGGLAGLSSLIFRPNDEGKVGTIGSFFKTISAGMLFGGTLTSRVGQALNVHKEYARGSKYIEDIFALAEKRGQKIFRTYSEKEIDKLVEKSEDLDKVLVYEAGIKESILERYAKDDIGGLFDGPPGTGKTEGVNLILGKWADRTRQEGFKPVIASLDLANFGEVLKSLDEQKEKLQEFINAGLDLGNDGIKNLAGSNQALMILEEALVKKISKLVRQVAANNADTDKTPQKLVVLVDEFDKVLDTGALKGSDRQRLKNLLVRFNELFMEQRILLTSNKTLEEMVEGIRGALYKSQEDTGEEIWGPLQNRLAAKNRTRVMNPSPKVQGEIMAGTLLTQFPNVIDWDSFGLKSPANDFYELNRKTLGEALSDQVLEPNKSALVGRELKYASEDIMPLLLGRARLARFTQTWIPDSQWKALSSMEKIERTGVKIDKALIDQVIKLKKSNISERESDPNLTDAFNIVESYLKSQAEKVSKKAVLATGKSDLLEQLGQFYNRSRKDGEILFMAKKPVDYKGEKLGHVISYKSSNIHDSNTRGSFTISYMGSKAEKGQKPGLKQTKGIPYSEMRDEFSELMKDLTTSELSKGVKNFIGDMSKELKTQATIHQLGHLLGNLAS